MRQPRARAGEIVSYGSQGLLEIGVRASGGSETPSHKSSGQHPRRLFRRHASPAGMNCTRQPRGSLLLVAGGVAQQAHEDDDDGYEINDVAQPEHEHAADLLIEQWRDPP